MSESALNILFLCTGNSARSIMAEAAASDPAIGLGKLRGYSAGSFPTGQVHPVALSTLQQHAITPVDPRSKSWDEFLGPKAPPIDVMITVCDRAAAESCPIWPGQSATAHWGVPDPAAVLDPLEQAAAFESAFQVLKRRIARFAQLDLARLSAAEISAQARRIGEQD